MESRLRSSAAPPTKRTMFSPTASRSLRRWGRTLCFTIMQSRPGASTEMGGFAMFSPKQLFAGAAAAALLVLPAYAFDFGRPASSDEIKQWDIDVRPDGKGLPDGSGTAGDGKEGFAQNCAACPGEKGQGGMKDSLVGGQGP